MFDGWEFFRAALDAVAGKLVSLKPNATTALFVEIGVFITIR